MTAMAQNSELMLFITHVETDGPLLKIWGQIDRNAATCVERMILPLSEKFGQGLGIPNPNYTLPSNVICCARFQNDGYYRAKICNVQPNGNVLVHFIDYGNFEVLPLTAIRLLDNIPSAGSLHGLPPLALDFILANVLPVNGTWDSETVESIKQSLRYADLKGMLHSVIGSHRLLKLCYNNEDFGDLLVSKNLAVAVSLQEMFSAQRQVQQPHLTQFTREVTPIGNRYSPKPPSNTYAEPQPRPPLGAQNDWRSAQHRQPPPPPSHVPEALVFKSRVLDVGSIHDVYVSFVEDGPLKFSVQVKSTAQILTQLMNDINKHPTTPLQEPPLPGSVCLGRYSLDKVLCRAVVMAVMEQKCKVYYVDFGHTEVLPYSDIFQLPPQYINPRVLSIRFTLSGLKDLNITDHIKEYFKKIVTGKPLVLQVRPPEGPPLIQYGDLYDGGINIRDLLKDRCVVTVPVFYQNPPSLERGFKDIVHVSYVESFSKFFVQLDSGLKSLHSIMACLAEYAQKAPLLDKNSLQVGWPCCASYIEDKQWYRAQILSINGDQVTVLYVDYGNEETVPMSELRKIHDDLVKNLRAQAVRCTLNEFQTSTSNQEITDQFEALVLEKKLAMEVVDVLPKVTRVNLYDCSVAPMVNIASKLRIPNQSMRAGNVGSHRNGEQILNSSRSPETKLQSDDRNTKWGKSGKPNTWGSDTKSGDWGIRNRKSQFDHNNHERPITKIVKDIENEQRQRDSNRYDGEDHLHHKEPRNNHFNRHESGGSNRYEKDEESGSRRGRGGRFGSGGRISRDDNRFDKNISKDDSWSDRDSDTSSRSGGKRSGRGPRGIKGRGDRGSRRVGERKSSTGRWSDGDSDRGSHKSNQSSGFRSKDRNSSNSSWKNPKTQPNKTGSWNSMSPSSPIKNMQKVETLRIPSPNITVGAIKNSEITFIASPTDFYVQLHPDNRELDTLMEKIAQIYNNGGAIIKSSNIQPGMYCIAQYSADSKWYRAVIQSNNVDSANVNFIDYGNTEVVGHDKIKELRPEFVKLSAQAVHCKLFGVTKMTWSDEELDQFSQAAEGTCLEAEFVSQENGVYEVLIKLVKDDTSDTNYVNEQFCGDVNLMQAKKEAKNKVKSTGKKTHITSHYISAGEKWREEFLVPGCQVDVLVTWFVNPNNFYCQILNKQSEFRTMMNDIQESYVKQQPIKNTLKVGTPVVAFFSDDGALYRAEIKELNKLRGHIVQYIDFGNCAMVDPCKIYPVEKRFAVLPKQAIHCTLRNILPATGVGWSKANKHEIDRYFDADKYKCTFYGTKDGKYSITLSNNGKDIGEALIAAGLAVNSEENEQMIVTEVSSAEKNLHSADVPKVDLTVWSGQTIRTNACHVQGAAQFYVQLPASVKSADNLKNSVTSEQDAGQNYLVECHLYNVTPTPQVDSTLQKLIEGQDVIVNIKAINNERLAVQLYDTSGKKLKLVQSDTDEEVSPICPLPISNLTLKVWVTHIDNSENLWLQRSLDLDNIADLLSSLYEYYSASGIPCVPEVGKLCVVLSKDENWYRAVIKNVKETEVTVRFIDYGNTEEIPFNGIKQLEPQFYIPHQMAIKVSLIVSVKGTEDEQKTLLHQHLDGKEFTATFYNVKNEWLVELSEYDKKISATLSELNLVAEMKNTELQQEEIPEIVVGNRYEVFLSHSDSPAQFWLQRNEEIPAIEVMQANLQTAALNFLPITGIPEEGTLCAALYSADNMWYRAEVLDADEDITTVRFIDYGNTDVVDSNSANIKELPQSWKSIKKYGLKSRLDLIPTGSEDWSTSSCEMFEKMATSTASPITALIIADSVPRRVELFVGEKSIGDALVKEGHAIMVHNAEDLIDELIDLELDPRSAFVSHVNSPSEFWVQEQKSRSDLEIMTDRFIIAELFPKLEEIVEGTLCVAKFPDDEQWYRARVKSHSALGTEVLYIDWGNSAVSTEIRAIPEDLAVIPSLSRKCSLQLQPGVKEWSVKACEKFIDLAADGATIFLLDVIKEGETSIVNLTLDGTDVADELMQFCDVLPVIDERLPPLGEENSPNIVVSHVNSPSEFWTQVESSIGELEIMASRLIDAQSLLPLNTFEEGTICAAKFPEDGEWYRAKILSHDESGTNVLYFDYGNSALTTELRILPADVANIPSLATRCMLALPDDVESWSQEACEKFVQLVSDGATMFQFEIFNTNDPSLISLQLEGEDVIDILKPLCKQKVSSENKTTVGESMISVTIDNAVKYQEGVKINANEPECPTEISKESASCEAKENGLGSEKLRVNDSDSTQYTGEKIQTDNLTIGEVENVQINENKETKANNPVVRTTEEIENNSDDLCEAEEGSVDILNISKIEEIQINKLENVPAKIDSSEVSEENNIDRIKDKPIDEEQESAEITESVIEKIKPSVDILGVCQELVDPPKLEADSQTTQVSTENVVTIATNSSDKPVEEYISKDSVTSDFVSIKTESVPEEVTKTTEIVQELTVDDIVGSMVKPEQIDIADEIKVEKVIPEKATEHEIIFDRINKHEQLSEDVSKDHPSPQKTPKMDKIVPGSISRGSIDEDFLMPVVSRRRSSCTDDKVVPGGINKGNDLTRAESLDSLHRDDEKVIAAPERVKVEDQPISVTPAKSQHEDKIVPGSISRGESPSVELNRPTTPKTPHSEKLLAGVVTLQDNLMDFDKEDETLIVEVENNIPKYSS